MKNEFQYRLLKSIGNANMTAAELAEKTGISEASISNYINGKYVAKQDKCYAIAIALGVDPGWLMTGEEPRKRDPDEEFVEEYIRRYKELFPNAQNNAPVSREARIVARAIDKMPKEKREQALQLFKIAFPGIIEEE